MKTITYFTSKTCAPCKVLLPKVEKIADQEGVQLHVVDIDQNPALAQRAGVMSVPTLLFTHGEPVTSETKRLQANNARLANIRWMLVEM